MVLPIKGLSRIDLSDVFWLVYSFDFPSAAAELRVPTQELVTFWQLASTIGHTPVSPKHTLTTLSSCCQAAIYTSVKQQSSGSNATLHRKHTYSVLSFILSVVCVICFFFIALSLLADCHEREEDSQAPPELEPINLGQYWYADQTIPWSLYWDKIWLKMLGVHFHICSIL